MSQDVEQPSTPIVKALMMVPREFRLSAAEVRMNSLDLRSVHADMEARKRMAVAEQWHTLLALQDMGYCWEQAAFLMGATLRDQARALKERQL